MNQGEGEHTCIQIQFKNLHKQNMKHRIVDLGSYYRLEETSVEKYNCFSLLSLDHRDFEMYTASLPW